MRGARIVGSLALLVGLAPACDTTQPLQLTDQLFGLTMRGSGGVVPIYDAYDMYEDSARCQGDTATRCSDDGDCVGTGPCVPADGVADDNDGDGTGDLWLWCRNTASSTNTTTASSVPFGFTIEVTILRAGTTEREQVTSPVAMEFPLSNKSEYDANVLAIPGAPPAQAPIVVGDSTYEFTNPRRLSAAAESVAAATSNPVSDANPGTYGLGNGLCSTFYWGPAVIDAAGANQYPLEFVLNKGDNVTVKAIRADAFPSGVPIQNPAAVQLLASLSSEGRTVEVQGTFFASAAEPSMVFTFTAN
jgi:hypothetical protein